MIPMAYHYGFKPWDIDCLTILDFEVYKAGLDEMARQSKDAEQGGQPRRPTRRR